MTIREFYKAVAASNVSDEIKTFATEALAKINTPSKAQIANEHIKQAILEALATAPHVASELATAVEVSTQKASALCLALVAEGKITQTEIKVRGKGKVKQYSIVK